MKSNSRYREEMPRGFLLPSLAALRGSLCRALDEGTHLDSTRAHGGNPCGGGDGFVEMCGLDEVVPAELLPGFGKRTVGHQALAVAHADAGGCRSGVQLRPSHILSGRLDLLIEFHEFSHETLSLGLGELGPSFLFVVNEQHVFHWILLFTFIVKLCRVTELSPIANQKESFVLLCLSLFLLSFEGQPVVNRDQDHSKWGSTPTWGSALPNGLPPSIEFS